MSYRHAKSVRRKVSGGARSDWGAKLVAQMFSFLEWPTIFEATALWLRETLGNDLVLRVEHFGSTAIPGRHALPVIDMHALDSIFRACSA